MLKYTRIQKYKIIFWGGVFLKYKIFKPRSEINPDIFTYGIKAVENGKTLTAVADISTDAVYVRTLIALFEKHGLAPIHLKDALEDFLVK